MENPPSNPHLQVMGQEKNAALHGWAERALAAGGEKDWRSIFGGPRRGRLKLQPFSGDIYGIFLGTSWDMISVDPSSQAVHELKKRSAALQRSLYRCPKSPEELLRSMKDPHLTVSYDR